VHNCYWHWRRVVGVACHVAADEGMLVSGTGCTSVGIADQENPAEICTARRLQDLDAPTLS